MLSIKHAPVWSELEGGDPDTKKSLSEWLSFVDPREEYIRQRQGRPSKVVHLFQKDRFPTGLISRVRQWASLRQEPLQETCHEHPLPPTPVELPDWLYDHQRKGIQAALDLARGIICAPTGSGKTVLAGHYLRHFPTARALVTVPTLDLLAQTAKSLEECLGEKVGRISGVKHDWQRVTVGVINSLEAHRVSFRPYLQEIDVVVVDECHRSSADRYARVLNECVHAARRIGVSATPYSSRGLDMLMESILGPMLYRVTEEEITALRLIIRPEYIVIPCEDPKILYPGVQKDKKGRLFYPTDNGKPERLDVYKMSLVENPHRNDMILELVSSFLSAPQNGGLLVIVNHVEHGHRLQALAKDKGLAAIPFLHGSSPKAERLESLDLMRANQLPVLIASSIFNEGTDIPSLRAVILAGGGGSKRVTIQQVGRALRSAPGKTRAIVVDFYDKERFYLASNYRSRTGAVQSRFPDTLQIMTLAEAQNLLSKTI